MEHTLAIIKPDAVKAQYSGAIIERIEKAGFNIQQITKKKLSKAEAKIFYNVHKERPFYDDLCTYISSGPIIVMHLSKKNAIASYRELIGATNPDEAEKGTIRAQFGTSIDRNAIHGSDAPETAKQEIEFFFGKVSK